MALQGEFALQPRQQDRATGARYVRVAEKHLVAVRTLRYLATHRAVYAVGHESDEKNLSPRCEVSL